MKHNPKLQIKYSESFIKAVCKRAQELIHEGKHNGVLEDNIFGKLSIFINKEPDKILMIIPVEFLPFELTGYKIFIGG